MTKGRHSIGYSNWFTARSTLRLDLLQNLIVFCKVPYLGARLHCENVLGNFSSVNSLAGALSTLKKRDEDELSLTD